VLILKINLKNKKYFFKIFLNKKYFEIKNILKNNLSENT
jgi:hypothetical protein